MVMRFYIQPFGNHLRTDKNIRLSLFKIGDDTLVGRACAGGIQIHTGNGGFGKRGFDVVLYLFRTETAVAQVRSFASGTDAGQLIGISAIVAGQLVQSFMIGQADITVLTLSLIHISSYFVWKEVFGNLLNSLKVNHSQNFVRCSGITGYISPRIRTGLAPVSYTHLVPTL